MSIKILHILHDEKFIDGAIDTFNSTSAINTYVSIEDTKPFNRIKSHASDVLIIGRDEILSFIVSGGFQLVAFHTLTRDKYELVLNIPKNIKVLWLSWGYDIYEPWNEMPPVLSLDLYKKETKSFFNVPIFTRFKRLVKKIIFFKRYQKIRNDRRTLVESEVSIQKKLLARVDYMSTVLPAEFEMLSELPEFRAKYIPFQYANRNSFDITTAVDNVADKILLGNSATPTNNHISVLDILRKKQITNECVLPCSYGSDEYWCYLKGKLNDYNNVCVLKDFMPYDDYVALINSCRVGIFGHLRQQAIGNILLCMCRGCKVFLYKDSIAYKYFKESGYVIFSIDDDLSQDSIDKLLTDEERLINVSKLQSQFAFNNVVCRLEKILNKISSNLCTDRQ